MVNTTIVKMTPLETTTEGYMKIKEHGQDMTLLFQARDDFRGKLSTITWSLPDGVEHTITPEDDDFAFFGQVGERPEIAVSNAWLTGLELPAIAQVRIKFTFDTFRMEPVWYAYLYIMTTYGDSDVDAKTPYKI